MISPRSFDLFIVVDPENPETFATARAMSPERLASAKQLGWLVWRVSASVEHSVPRAHRNDESPVCLQLGWAERVV